MKANSTSNHNLKYNKLITLVSVVVPVLVAVLFSVRIPNVAALDFLPPIYATINGLTAVIQLLMLP